MRLLSYGVWHFDMLYGCDLEFADWVWKQDGQIGAMKALEIGDQIEIVDGLSLSGRLKKAMRDGSGRGARMLRNKSSASLDAGRLNFK